LRVLEGALDGHEAVFAHLDEDVVEQLQEEEETAPLYEKDPHDASDHDD
jgi:hypothetical protein